MFYYIYQITNLVNNKIYVGVHKTKNLDDGYMGSGKVIKRAIDTHGIDNFKKDILEFFENAELMYAREKEIVDDEFLLREDTYNLRRGGYGGFDFLNKTGLNNSTKTKEQLSRGGISLSNLRKNDEEKMNKHRITCSNTMTNNHKNGLMRYDTFIGKTHTEHTKSKISEKNSKHQMGEGNSQYGTCWITNGLENRKIKNTDIIPDNWYRGRKINKGP